MVSMQVQYKASCVLVEERIGKLDQVWLDSCGWGIDENKWWPGGDGPRDEKTGASCLAWRGAAAHTRLHSIAPSTC
jgi:hypothetical protein